MLPRWTLPLLLASLVTLSGCLDDEAPDEDTDDDGMDEADPVSQDVQFADSGMLLVGNDSLGNTDTGCGNLDEEGVDTVTHTWTLPAEVNGTAVRVAGLEVTLTLVDPTLTDADLFVYDPDGNELGRSTEFNVQTGASESVTVSGTHAPGDYEIVVKGCTGSGSYDVSASATLRG